MIRHYSHVIKHSSSRHHHQVAAACNHEEMMEPVEQSSSSQPPLKLLDMCCGSGAIAVSLLQECPWVCRVKNVELKIQPQVASPIFYLLDRNWRMLRYIYNTIL